MFINVGFITSMLEKQNTGLNEVIDMPSKHSQLHDLVRSQVGRHLENELVWTGASPSQVSKLGLQNKERCPILPKRCKMSSYQRVLHLMNLNFQWNLQFSTVMAAMLQLIG